MCGYFCASARIKFDDEQFAALFNELRCDKTKLMQLSSATENNRRTIRAILVSSGRAPLIRGLLMPTWAALYLDPEVAFGSRKVADLLARG
jgi:hypothetical protein